MSRLSKLRRLKWLTIAYEVKKNLGSRARERRGRLRAITAHGATLEEPAQRVAYSRNVFTGFVGRSGLDREQLDGLRVLELGPGEDLGVALRFLAAGAAQVTCIDRFDFDVDPDWEREVYRLVLEEQDAGGQSRLAGLLAPDGELHIDGDRLEAIRGVGIEEGAARVPERLFDLIVSIAVLEHVYDLPAAFRAMDTLLAPGGVMVHQVDLRDHGMFSAGGRHPLEFLTIRDPVYRLMTSHTGAPNRERIGTYRKLLGELGHEATINVTSIAGRAESLDPYRERIEVEPALAGSIEGLRGRLPPRFAALPLEDLATTGIVIRSEKPTD